MRGLGPSAIIDEIQYAPSLFREIKAIVDANGRRPGQLLLTGSQKFSLMKSAVESLAGRLSVFELDTLSAAELHAAALGTEALVQRGGFPELWVDQTQASSQFYGDYVSTYLERDLRSLLKVDSLRTFDRFLRALALRVGSLMNYTEIAKDVGVAPNTLKAWTEVLTTSGLVHLLEPFFSNRTKRLVKTPKLYFRDNGLLCYLAQVNGPDSWHQSALKGKIWENFVFTELFKAAEVGGFQRALFFWREKSGREIDFMIEGVSESWLIDAKAAELPDGASLRFADFEKMHPQIKMRRLVACLHPSPGMATRQGFEMFNPTLTVGPWAQ